MPVLLDSNQLLRIAQPEAEEYPIVRDAVIELLRRHERPFICPQNLYEFWSVATRPPGSANGLGMTPEEAEAEIKQFEVFFPLLPDIAAVYTEWRTLITRFGITGLQAHDARLVATMIAHRVPTLLTFNKRHFRRFIGHVEVDGRPLRILEPDDVLA